LRAHTQTLSDVFAYAPRGDLNVKVDGQAEIASGQLVTGGFYAGLGVRTVVGRTIAEDDDREDAAPVAVISHRYWQRRFGPDQAVEGKTVIVNNVPFTIIGVTPPRFYGGLQLGSAPDLSFPLAVGPRLNPMQGPNVQGRSEAKEAWYWWVRVI